MKKKPVSIEMGNIPDVCQASAAASMLALVKPMEWVFVPLTGKKKPYKFDLRFRGVA